MGNTKVNLKNKSKIIKSIILVLFIIYVLILIYQVFIRAYGTYDRVQVSSISYNLYPLKTIINYIKYYERVNFTVWFFNIFGNIIAFMPLGFFLPLIFKRLSKFRYTLIIGVVSSLLIEILQIVFAVGCFDIDDIILNSTGIILGYMIYIVFRKYFLCKI
ncbi:VanZ family protein [Abyssisolibacter fermentans]|uniref:VanZ family protein n=1 Tax=Abyssisolibacter fermentans TaxID=1766203 RepID=UPI00083337AF|nr:VanZ family protein [Abyssisolibacter fermentans]